MKLGIIILLFIVCMSVSAQNPKAHWMKYATPEEAGFSTEKIKLVDSLYAKNGASALMVIYDGNVLLSKGDVTRKYDCHSIRKSLMSGLYGAYADKGMINIHRTLNQLGIDEPIKLTEEEKLATIQDLLKSRSGIYIPAYGEGQIMKDLRPARGSHQPNTFFFYNNWDFNVLGAIFQNETHLNLFKAFEESFAEPLHMEDFKITDGRFWVDSTENTIYPKYDIKISARDLARFGTLYVNEGVWNKKQVLSKQWIAESFTSYSPIDHGSYQEGYGYMWWIETIDDSITMYSARGYGGHILTIVPKENLVMVKRHDTYNTTGGDGWTGNYIREIIKAKNTSPKPNPKLIPLDLVEPAKIKYVNLSPGQLKKYQQKIYMEGRMRKIEYTPNGLLFDDWFILDPVSESKFYMEDLQRYLYFKFLNNRPIFDKIE